MTNYHESIVDSLGIGSGLVRDAEAQSFDQDVVLVREFISGRTSAFDLLYKRHASRVYNICLGILGNPDDARDAMQETFVQVFRSLPKFRLHSKFCTWLYRIAVNKCVDAVRRRPRWEVKDSLEDFRCEVPSNDNRLVEEIRFLVTKLKPSYRAVLVLYYFQQFSYGEIAETLGWSVEQVRSNLHRARRALRKLYDRGDDFEV
jgi:RNA polymerase sigma-70 factor (ECF subfamily)